MKGLRKQILLDKVAKLSPLTKAEKAREFVRGFLARSVGAPARKASIRTSYGSDLPLKSVADVKKMTRKEYAKMLEEAPGSLKKDIKRLSYNPARAAVDVGILGALASAGGLPAVAGALPLKGTIAGITKAHKTRIVNRDLPAALAQRAGSRTAGATGKAALVGTPAYLLTRKDKKKKKRSK